MLSAALISALQDKLRHVLGGNFQVERVEPVGGGSINTALRLHGAHGSVFAKLRSADDLPMFEAEADGLRALSICEAIKTPRVLGYGRAEGSAYLLLEWLDIAPLRTETEARRAGEALAELHRCTDEHFGWRSDNFIGSTPQCNTESDNWSRFFVQQRLTPQFALAASKGFQGRLRSLSESICNKVPALFLDYRPKASLLHGDLWSGNIAALADGTPVLYDPACYRGDREADLAMSELFGGLPLGFYLAYRQSWPLNEGYELRKPLYNLYHILNHLNLFGSAYFGPAERMLAQLARTLQA